MTHSQIKVAALAVSCLMPLTVSARLGETPAQCDQRYGTPLAERPGKGNISLIRVYKKEDLHVTVAFAKQMQKTETNSCIIIYTKYDGKPAWYAERKIHDDIVKGLMATVPGTWKSYEDPNQLAKIEKKNNTKALLTKPPQISLSLRNKAAELLQTIFPEIMSPTTIYPTKYIDDLGHISSMFFAFKRNGCLILISSNGIEAMQSWKNVIDSQPKQLQPTPVPPKGF